MPQSVNDEAAFLIRRRDYRNSSLMLDLWTRHYGRVTVISRGGKKRRDVASLQVGYRLAVNWSGQGELKNLSHVDSRPILISQDCYAPLFYLNELILYLLPREDAYPELFDQYQMALLEISLLSQSQQNTISEIERMLRGFEIRMLTALGLMPDLCHEYPELHPISEEQHYQLIPGHGFQMIKTESGQIKTGISGKVLGAISRLEFSETDVLRQAKAMMRQLIDFHLNGRTLQSRKFYLSLKKQKTELDQ